jgi:hypothetical protein
MIIFGDDGPSRLQIGDRPEEGLVYTCGCLGCLEGGG